MTIKRYALISSNSQTYMVWSVKEFGKDFWCGINLSSTPRMEMILDDSSRVQDIIKVSTHVSMEDLTKYEYDSLMMYLTMTNSRFKYQENLLTKAKNRITNLFKGE